MVTTTTGIRLVPERNRHHALLWRIAEGWSRAFGIRAMASDVARRWQIEHSTCEQLPAELIDGQVLLVRADGWCELVRSQ